LEIPNILLGYHWKQVGSFIFGCIWFLGAKFAMAQVAPRIASKFAVPILPITHTVKLVATKRFWFGRFLMGLVASGVMEETGSEVNQNQFAAVIDLGQHAFWSQLEF